MITLELSNICYIYFSFLKYSYKLLLFKFRAFFFLEEFLRTLQVKKITLEIGNNLEPSKIYYKHILFEKPQFVQILFTFFFPLNKTNIVYPTLKGMKTSKRSIVADFFKFTPIALPLQNFQLILGLGILKLKLLQNFNKIIHPSKQQFKFLIQLLYDCPNQQLV